MRHGVKQQQRKGKPVQSVMGGLPASIEQSRLILPMSSQTHTMVGN